MELGLAIYGAIVGTAALAWGVFEWVRARRPDVLVFQGYKLSDAGTTLQATVVNRGQHPVRVESYTFRKPGQVPYPVWTEGNLGPIPPSDAVVLEAPLNELLDWAPGDVLVAEVSLTTGDRFSSKAYPAFEGGIGE